MAELWSRGTLGLESRDEAEQVVLTAYFGRDRLRSEAWSPGARRVGGLAVEVVSIEDVPERDWIAEYRSSAAPFALGAGFWVEPGEAGTASSRTLPRGRRLLRLPARRAFGTGSHESSRLVVEILESLPVSGKRVLDVGAGSGLLSFVAVHLGAASVTSVECDWAAALVARENQRLNRIGFALFAGTVDALAEQPRFDLAAVNVIPERIAADLAGIERCLQPGSLAVFSGCLARRARRYQNELERNGFRVVESRDQGEWRALLAEVARR
ncbi:MAG: 50S ribosomal protein L11 methyltransferase [Thermoanaerobaculia bacterium]